MVVAASRDIVVLGTRRKAKLEAIVRRNCSGRAGYGLAPTTGIQGWPVNRSRSTAIALWPCLRAVER